MTTGGKEEKYTKVWCVYETGRSRAKKKNKKYILSSMLNAAVLLHRIAIHELIQLCCTFPTTLARSTSFHRTLRFEFHFVMYEASAGEKKTVEPA